jgi:hypothetical protein
VIASPTSAWQTVPLQSVVCVASLIVTVPLPVAAAVIVTTVTAKVAVALSAAWMLVSVQVAVSWPAHAPLQLAKLKPATGVAVNVTVLPAVPEIVHAMLLVVQLVGVALASLAVTEPLPPLAALIASVVAVNVAVALTAA